MLFAAPTGSEVVPILPDVAIVFKMADYSRTTLRENTPTMCMTPKERRERELKMKKVYAWQISLGANSVNMLCILLQEHKITVAELCQCLYASYRMSQ